MAFRESPERWVSRRWEETSVIWINGAVVPWKDAKTHFLTPAIQYGENGFEGIRYRQLGDSSQRAVFRLDDHIERFRKSALAIDLELPFSSDQIREGIFQVIQLNGELAGYIRPWFGSSYGDMGVGKEADPANPAVDLGIAAWPWGNYLPDRPITLNLINPEIANVHPGAIFPEAKVSANYTKSAIAKRRAKKNGYDEALILASDGTVAEASAQNIFAVTENGLETPKENILKGITRDTIIQVARTLGIPVKERSDMYPQDFLSARGVFLTGTASGIVPVGSIDETPIGNGQPEEVIQELMRIYADIVTGRDPRFNHWLTVIPSLK